MIFNITKENTTLTKADFAVDFLAALKGALFLALYINGAVFFVMWEVNTTLLRLSFILLGTSILIHFLQSKYRKVLQEHIKATK